MKTCDTCREKYTGASYWDRERKALICGVCVEKKWKEKSAPVKMRSSSR